MPQPIWFQRIKNNIPQGFPSIQRETLNTKQKIYDMEKMKFETKLKTLKTNNSPLIKAAFQGKDGNVYFGIMLIDTGSFDCILNKSVMDLLDDSAVRKGDSKNISTIQGESNECYAVDFTFKMGNNQEFSDVFYVSEASDFDQILVGMIGIVGSKFLIRHQLTLDYAKEMLYTSDGTFTHPDNCEFFFPMEYGFKNYGIPVVGISSGENEFIMLVDSGADKTVMTSHMIDEAGLPNGNVISNGILTLFNNRQIKTTIKNVEFSLLSVGGTEDDPKLCSYEDNVQVIDEPPHIMENFKDPEGEELPPISGMLSSSFMYRHKWILDFKTGIVYSKLPE